MRNGGRNRAAWVAGILLGMGLVVGPWLVSGRLEPSAASRVSEHRSEVEAAMRMLRESREPRGRVRGKDGE